MYVCVCVSVCLSVCVCVGFFPQLYFFPKLRHQLSSSTSCVLYPSRSPSLAFALHTELLRAKQLDLNRAITRERTRKIRPKKKKVFLLL